MYDPMTHGYDWAFADMFARWGLFALVHGLHRERRPPLLKLPQLLQNPKRMMTLTDLLV